MPSPLPRVSHLRRNLSIYSVACDFISEGSFVAPSLQYEFTCGATPGYVGLMVFGWVMLLLLLVLTLVGTLMHENDPKSYSLLTRVHSRLDMAYFSADLVLLVVFVVFAGRHRALLGFLYVAGGEGADAETDA